MSDSPLSQRQPDGAVFVAPLSWKAISATCCPRAHHLVHKYLGQTMWSITNTDRFDSKGQRLPDVQVLVEFCPFCGTRLPVGAWSDAEPKQAEQLSPPPVDREKTTLTDGRPVTADHREIDPETGMQKGYVVLSAEERAKGFVRPVRRSYRHVGIRPRFQVRDLTDAEKERYASEGYVKYEEYPESERPAVGRFWTARQLQSGCGSVTTMGQAIAETFARDPAFYGGTMCVQCKEHFHVGAQGEFVWVEADGSDGPRVGT